MSIFIASLDLGQVNDYAALVIVEAKGTTQKYQTDEPHPEVRVMHTVDHYVETMPLVQLDVLHAERFDLGTKYAVVAHETRKRIEGIPRRGQKYFVLDKTGVGMAAIEFFTHLSPIGITFTAGKGEKAEQDAFGQWQFDVPKRNLVAAAQVLLQNHVMKIAAGMQFASVLMNELTAFKMKISLAGHDTYEAWRERDHDDLVNALAMACWLSNTIISANALTQVSQNRWEEPPGISAY
jgi:hypothetical protein